MGHRVGPDSYGNRTMAARKPRASGRDPTPKPVARRESVLRGIPGSTASFSL